MRRLSLACVLLSAVLVAGCGEDARRVSTDVIADTRVMDTGGAGDAGDVVIEDTSSDATPDVEDAEDAEDAEDTEDVEPGVFDCVASCVEWGEELNRCFGDLFRAEERSLALRVGAGVEVGALREVVGSEAVIEVNGREGVALIEGLAPEALAELEAALGRVTGVEGFLPVRTEHGRAAVVLPRIALRFDAAPTEVKGFFEARGLEVLGGLGFGAEGYLLAVAPALDPLAVAATLSKEAGVRYAQADRLRRYAPRQDPLLAQQWHLDAGGVEGVEAHAAIMAPEAWEVEEGDASVVIGIYDDGVDTEHPDLRDSVVPGAPALFNDLSGAISQGAAVHGTAVAGVAAADADNDRGGRGVCPGCRIWPELNDHSLEADSVIAGRLGGLVDAGVSVINCSWGPIDGNPLVVDENSDPEALGQVLIDAFEYAETTGRGGLGVVITWAAGNGNEPVSTDPFASHPTVVAVAASDDRALKSWYSDFGPEILVTAPSSGGRLGILTSIPTGPQTYGEFVEGIEGERYTLRFGGTSSAAPTVAGVAGLMLSANPALSAAEVRGLLASTADPIDRLRGQYDADGHSPFYGHGRVNAYRAVLAAQGDGCDGDRVELCNGVDDNCDGEVDEVCGQAADCEACAYDSGCLSGVCANTPGDAGRRCLSPCDVEGGCEGESVCQAGLCVPPEGRCQGCASVEACDGVDDDCDGEVDEEGACDLSEDGRCAHDAECGEQGFCAMGTCRVQCENDAECGGDPCLDVTLRYGDVGQTRSCGSGATAACLELVCSAPALSTEDREGFFKCLNAAQGSCGLMFRCAGPVIP